MKARSVLQAAFAAAAMAIVFGAASCGYHAAGRADLIPKNIHTIAIPAFGNGTARYKLARLLSADVTREFIARTKYRIVADPAEADAVLNGVLNNFVTLQIGLDPTTGRATGAQVIVTVSVTLTDKTTGKVLISLPAKEYRERYEISIDPQTYFDESGTAVERLSRDVARTVVTSVLAAF